MTLVTTTHPRSTVLTWHIRHWVDDHGWGDQYEAELYEVHISGKEAHEPTWYRELKEGEWQQICDERDEQIDWEKVARDVRECA